MLAVAVALAVALVLYAVFSRGADPTRAEAHSRAFDQALATETSTAAKALLRLARPLAGVRVANPTEESPTYRALRLKLQMAGGLYSSSVEVFLSVQVLCFLVAGTAITGVVVAQPGTGPTIVGVLGSLAVCGWPYSRIWEAAAKRSNEVNKSLPEFAEMLLMPLGSGYGILASLDFTASRMSGPVADEVRILTEAIKSRSRTEAQAFADAAESLGTSSALSFFTALSQAYLEGTKVIDTIRGQAQSLRKAEYERVRADIKKIPTQAAVVLGIHLMPSLFIITLYPTFYALGTLS